MLFFRNPFVLLALFVLLLLGGRTVWYNHYTLPEHPRAIQGILDMRNWDFERSRMIPLEGEWEFYPDRLLSEEEVQAGNAGSPRYLRTPGDWRSAWSSDSGDPYGYGTYRLRILLDGSLEQPYEFWFDNVRTSSQVEINGKVLARLGHPGERRQDYTPVMRSYTVSYAANGEKEIDLLVQVANFDEPRYGGITSAVRFGSQAAIDTERWYSIGLQLVAFVIFLLHGLYALILYALNPRQRSLIVFGLFLICVAATIVASSDRLLLQWLPLSYSAMTKTARLSYVFVSFLMTAMTLKLTGLDVRSRWLRLYAVVLAVSSVFMIAAPIRIVETARLLYTVLYLLPILAVVALFVWKVRRSPKDNLLLLLAATAAASSVFWGVFQSFGAAPAEFYPLDMIAALIAFSTFWFRQYFYNAHEIVRLNDRLKRNDRLKDEFLAHTAHELRTPLHGIINVAQTVLNEERASLRAQNAANMELLLTVGRRMSQLVNDLLDLARLQEKRIVLQPERLSLQAAASGVIAMLAYLAAAKPGLKVRMDIPESFPPVYADEKRIVQILFNLLHNAIKYTESGTIVLSAEAVGGMAAVHVKDTGIGMNEETQARVFRSYEQGSHGIGGGIGLGLTICKQLAELHGGQLTLKSEPNRGSDFAFTIPLYIGDPNALRETAAAREDGGSDDRPPTLNSVWEEARRAVAPLTAARLPEAPPGWPPPASVFPPAAELPKVLVVDDDPVNLEVLTGVLSADRYCVTTAGSGPQALTLLGTMKWDLVIADVMMPRMSGYELTLEIRKQFSISELPILLLTARSQPEDIYAGFAAGANDYVTKPADAAELQARVWSLTALKRSVQMSLRMEAAYLQAQIRPHFLFNTLNSLIALSDIDLDRMRMLGEAFTSFLRISFDFLNTETMVPLAHELELVRAYLYIEKERFDDRLRVEWQVEEGVAVQLPPLTIQPLVENAVRHGLLNRARGGTVWIRLAASPEGVRVEVEDDGKGMDEHTARELLADGRKSGGGIGLLNTDRRLRQAYGLGLAIRSAPGQGTSVSFVVPAD
ncbi:hybrid sensor histidine kinase/response regulator [Cohnella fermenti]|nr:ATP-binding protein [Cohnella fermenti]